MGFQYEEFYFSMSLSWFSIFYWFPFWSVGYLRVCFLIFDRLRWFITLFFSPKFIGFWSDYLVCMFSPFNLYSFYMPRKMILCFVFYEYNKKSPPLYSPFEGFKVLYLHVGACSRLQIFKINFLHTPLFLSQLL